MKLQLLSADINSTLESQSHELVTSMPKAMREIAFIHRESQGLRVNLSDILKDMATIEHTKPSATAVAVAATPDAATANGIVLSPNTPVNATHTPVANPAPSTAANTTSTNTASTAASTIDFLQTIDVVNSRILRCTSTLEELDRWSKRERLVESLFDRITVTNVSSTGASGGSQVETLLPSLSIESGISDLARLQQELHQMEEIVNRFTTLGVAAKESTTRQTHLQAYAKKRDRIAQLLLEQVMETLAANQEEEEATSSAGMDDSSFVSSSSSSTLLNQLRILRNIYLSAGEDSTFQEAYARGVLRNAFKIVVQHHSVSGGSVDVKELEVWLPEFLRHLLRTFERERRFAQATFDTTTTTTAATTKNTNVNQGEKSLLASTGGLGGVSASSLESPQASVTASFVLPSIFEVLRAEFPPLVTTWVTTHLATKNGSDHTTILARLWSIVTVELGPTLENWMDQAAKDDAHEANAALATNTSTPILNNLTDTPSSPSQSTKYSHLLYELLSPPFERYFLDWSALEKKALFATLDRMEFGGESYDALAKNITEMHQIILDSTADGIKRCLEMSQGILIEPLISALNDYYTEVIQRLFSLLRRLRRIAGLDGVVATAGSSAPKKSPTVSGSSDSSLRSDASTTAAAEAQAQAADQAFASFQGAFTLLRTCRALQWDLFATHAEDSFVQRICAPNGNNQTGLVLIVRQAELELDGRTNSKKPPLTAHKSSAASPSPSSLTKHLAQSYLFHHPTVLRSLVTFLGQHFAPFHATSNDPAQATQGLRSNSVAHPITPTTGATMTMTPGVSGGVQRLNKYGLTPTPNMCSVSNHTGGSIFAASSTLCDSFVSALHNLILDTMFRPISTKLSTFHDWSHLWLSKSSAGLLSSIPLPSFSMQPSEYVIQIGEHLLTLVQQMEPYVAKQADEESVENGTSSSELIAPPSAPSLLPNAPPPPIYPEHDALYWLSLLSKGTFKHLISSIHQLNGLSERGSKQLACDLEYLVNVLSALGLTIPSTMSKLQFWLQWNETQLLDSLSEGRATDDCTLDELTADERHMLRQIIRARRFKQIEGNAQLQARLNQ